MARRRWLEPPLLSPVILKTKQFRAAYSAKPERRFRFWRWDAAAGCSRTKNRKTHSQAINLALDLGITYLDTAYGYGNGKSEGW
jgi:hypothetical protein